MAFDFKKAYKEFYQPAGQPCVLDVPAMRYIAVAGAGDPNAEGGAYQQAVGVLYAVAYTLKMSGRVGYAIPGFFDYVVPPLEGFWWQPGVQGVDSSQKDLFQWLAVIRLPDFITPEDVAWAKAEAGRKKKMDCAGLEFRVIREGLCGQILHQGAYDEEPATVAQLNGFLKDQGYVPDFSTERRHHEIYLSDPRRTSPAQLKTIIRHPVRKA